MGTGFLEVVTTTANGALPVPNARITVFNGENILYELVTDENGIAETVPLEAPAVELTLDPEYMGIPYSVVDVKAEAEGFTTMIIHDIEILDTETSILPIDMPPSLEEGSVVELYTPPHNLVSDEQRAVERPPEALPGLETRVLNEVIIPEFVIVHLGRPDNPNARNVRVPFKEYIKNSASHEIFSTWPPASLEANIYCIISFTLNRIFTEWYRVRGHRFDITNSTQFDQMFVEGGQIFRSIDEMVDRIFNRFVRREGHLEPYFTEYCDGRRVQCPGLWQWSTVTLAQQGLNALQILRRFYPNDIQIVETDNIGNVEESFPGFTLRPGMSGPEVRTIQDWLNRIRVNFPTIPPINASGVYGPQTEAAVRAFQAIRTLSSVNPNGVVDRTTWWNISRAYSAVKRLGELTSEGIVIGIGRTPPIDIIRQGSRGTLVGRAQYIMNFISQFYPSVPTVVQDFNFGPNFTAAVQEFQRLFGLSSDGVIGPLTWRMLYDIYWRIRDNVNLPSGPGGEPVVPPLPPTPPPPPPGPGGIPPYPGQLIRVGSRGDDVQRIQRCLNSVNNAGLATDGIFGPLTQAAVMNFQRSRGLNPDGIVGPLTWEALMPACYGGQTMGEYPGFLIREGARGDYVQHIQTCLNRVNNTGLATDGIFGPLTRAAVVNYQSANGLTPDGIVGPITWSHLRNRCGGVVAAGMIEAQMETVPELHFIPLEIPTPNELPMHRRTAMLNEMVDIIPVEQVPDVSEVQPPEMPTSAMPPIEVIPLTEESEVPMPEHVPMYESFTPQTMPNFVPTYEPMPTALPAMHHAPQIVPIPPPLNLSPFVPPTMEPEVPLPPTLPRSGSKSHLNQSDIDDMLLCLVTHFLSGRRNHN